MFPCIEHYTAADGYRLATRVWRVNSPAVRVVFVHGIISHSGWYGRTCGRLAAAGCEVRFLDRRGSGLNAAARGDVDRWETWCRDVEDYLTALPTDRPCVLAGISWGGKLVTAVARRRPDLLSRIVLVCPGLFARQSPGRVKRFAVRMATRVGLGSRRVTIPLNDPRLFTASPEWQAYVRTDPLTLRQVTLRFAAEDQKLSEFAIAAPETIHTPTLLLLAGRDTIVRNDAVARFVERFGTTEKRTITYPDAGHTFEFEPSPEAYWHDLVDWVLAGNADTE